jgi:hypothetical protein
MKNHFKVVGISVALLVFSYLAQSAQVSGKPNWTVELKTYGWNPAKSQSNRAFFKDFNLQKLEALDANTHISFIADDLIAVFHTKTEGEDWHSASREFEVFFLNAKDGSLAERKQWPAAMRGSGSDLIDSESRLVALNGGQFLVIANRTMLLYGKDFTLLNQKRFEPAESGDIWSVQVVDGGNKIFLRHQSAAKQQTSYQWLDRNSVTVLAEIQGPSGGRNFSVPVTAGDNCVLTSLPLPTRGITKLNSDGSSNLICSQPICQDDHSRAFSSRSFVISGRRGIGVVDTETGLLWAKENPIPSNLNEFQFGAIRTASSADVFGIWITAFGKRKFDGVQVGQIPTIFVYRLGTGKLVFTIPLRTKSGNFDFALSPDARSLAVFDGAAVSFYSIASEVPKN